MGAHVGVLVVASLFGCDAQVDHEYTGETLFSLQGRVLVRPELGHTDLVPRIAFTEVDTTVLIDGRVTGEFPAKFRLDVSQPPPTAAIYDSPEGGWVGRMAIGFLVLVPEDYPEHISSWLGADILDEQCNEATSICTKVVRECDHEERCRERTLECTWRPCDLLEDADDSALDPDTTDNFMSVNCGGASCEDVEYACDALGNCAIDVYRCNFGDYGSIESLGNGSMHTCTVVSEAGDGLKAFNDLHTVGLTHFVVYVEGDTAESRFGRLEHGYNLIALNTGGTGWRERTKCIVSNQAKAVAEYNEEHGTSYSGIALDDEVADLHVAAENLCGLSAGRVIERPLDEDLTIELGDLSPMLF